MSSADYQQGQWVHWAFTKNASTGAARVYRNGELFHSGSGLSRPMNGIGVAVLGAHIAGGSPWVGEIAELRIWNVERTADQIQELMNRLAAGTEPGLVYRKAGES